MYCVDTGEIPIVDVQNMVRVPMSVAEAQDIGSALHAVRTVGRGNGEICIPLFSGVFDKIKMTITSHRNKHKGK